MKILSKILCTQQHNYQFFPYAILHSFSGNKKKSINLKFSYFFFFTQKYYRLIFIEYDNNNFPSVGSLSKELIVENGIETQRVFIIIELSPYSIKLINLIILT